jgi:hypothetical protein
MLRNNKTLLLAEIEGTYGTDPTPAANTNAIVASNMKFEPIHNQKARSYVQIGMGSPAPLNLGEMYKITFTTDFIHPALATTTSPEIGPLLQACGTTESVSALDHADYALSELIDADKSVTFYGYRDGIRFIVKGARGNVKFNYTAGEIITLDWEFTGLYVDGSITAQSFPTPTYLANAPLVFQNATTTLGGTARIVQSFSLDLGNTISPRQSAAAVSGRSGWIITNREPVATLQVEAVALGTWNPYTKLESGATEALIITVPHPANALYKLTITLPAVFTKKVNEVDNNNTLAYSLDLGVHQSSAANDQILIQIPQV